MIRLKLLAIIASLALLAACSNGGAVSTGDAPTPDSTGDDVGIDAPNIPDAEDDGFLSDLIPEDTSPEDTTPNCEKLCEQVECGLAGPGDVCDCGGCDDGYGCSDDGICTADCGALCEDLECGVAGLEGECECGMCEDGYGCSDEGACTADCGALCEGLECGVAGLDGECECGACDDENPCTDDACGDDGMCAFVPLEDGESCDDGDLCTMDACEAGVCISTATSCDDENPCTDDACDDETGECVYTNNTAFCNDQDPCTADDVCADGVCAGAAIDCDCDVDEDCVPLEDDDLCNGTLVCNTAILPHQCEVDEDTVIECPEPEDGPDAPCLMAVCDAETGECGFGPDNDGAPCADVDACTVGEVCAEGTCGGGQPANCNDGNPCTDDSCDPAEGCVNTPNTASCEDGDICTLNDQCDDGECKGGAPLDCDDDNPCTADQCETGQGCVHAPTDGSCTDDNPCTLGDYCSGGLCKSTGIDTCDDGNPCTDDSCALDVGCQHVNNTAGCDDGDACTVADTCKSGACQGVEADCDDDNVCTDDYCIPSEGCVYLNNYNDCDDGNECTEGDKCVAGVCEGQASNCDDGNLCTNDSCDPTSGCVFAPNTVPCNDNDACTLGDVCADGICGGGSELNCNDNNPCTDDSCDPVAGCLHDDNNLECDDNNTCTTGDVCVDGACVGSGSLECDDANPCTKDICLPGGGCDHENVEGACSDKNACTLNDTCVDGLCVPGDLKDCNDNNPCTDDACDQAGICQHLPNEADCDDGNACTIDDYCNDGACGALDTLNCDDDNVCTTDSCSPLLGCVNAANTNPCNDLDACTTGDTCLDGACVSTGLLNCNDGNVCTDDACDPVDGCLNVFNVGPCEDGNECTVNVCAEGSCSTTAILECGGVCGACTDFPNSFCDEGFCACVKDTCADLGVECGVTSDGCGGTLSCGSCTALPNSFCDEGTCACAPDSCDSLGIECGPAVDGCEGELECGTCGGFEVCDPTGLCAPGGTGDNCTTPFTVTGIPFSATGTTDGAADDYGYSLGACAPEEGGYGGGAPDVVYEFVPAAHGLYRLVLTGDYDSNLYLITDCDDVDGSCVAGDEEACVGCDEEIVVELDADQIYYVIVDGWAGTAAGTYTLTIDEVGDTCADPVPVGALPFSWDGDTTGATPDYGYSTGQCPPETGGYGAGAPDEVYAFTPDETGFYLVELAAAYDSNLYIVTDCADVDGTCVAGDEDICSNCTESVTPLLTAGTTYYIVVDGYSNSSATNDGTYTLSVSVDCIPSCAGLVCGDDGCGGSCGTCTEFANSFCDAGACACASDTCEGLGHECNDWDDGCGGIVECGGCTEFVNSFCDAGTCACTPSTCADLGAQCGPQDDNCGGTVECGGCPGGGYCLVDECRPEGDTCANPFTVGALPFVGTGDTTGATPDYGYSVGACPPETGGWGLGARDQVWEFTPAITATYFVELDGSFDSNLYIVTDCGDVNGTCVAGDEDVGSTNPEELLIKLEAGVTYYIIADGWSNSSSQHGAYTLTIEAVGDTCASAHPVNSMPFSFQGSTVDATDQYSYTAGQCPPETGGWGSGSKDEVFTFTPAVNATFEIILDAGFDSNLYVITDCSDAGGSCVAGDEDPGTAAAEELILDLTAGVTYYIIVDGYSGASQQGVYTLTIEDVTCVPDTCADLGNTCGTWDDGCGGTLECGTCAPGEECFSGECLMIGDTCANPIVVDAIPYAATGDTTGATPDYGYSAGMCPPETGGWGATAPDLVYELTPEYTNDYAITLTGTAFDSNLYVVSDCGDIDNNCLAGDEDACSNCTEDVTVALTAGETYYVIVDGYAGATNDGPYALTIDCVPNTCAELGFECGTWDDGCGGMVTCAVCAGGDTCAAGTCLPAGDTCDNPITVGALPFSATGDTTGYGADHNYTAGQCPGENNYGLAAPDIVYAFTPAVDGDYVIQLTGTGFDSNLYVFSDCDDFGGSCLGADEDICSNCTESLELALTAGTTYFIVVDGYSNSSYTNDGPYTLTVDRLGDTCTAPFTIPVVPFSVDGDTTGYGADYGYSAGMCPPETGGYGGGAGTGAPDQVYALTAPYTNDYTITLTGVSFDSNLYVVSDCGDIDTNCIAGDEDICSNCTESVNVSLTAGETYYVIVDGYSNSSYTNDGAYTLTVDCVPDTCVELGYECGTWDDGCGGTVDCGGCGAGVGCNMGTCEFAGCSGGADVISLAPSGTIVLCDDPTDATCEQDFETLCPTDWHLCSHEEFNVRNDGWTQAYTGSVGMGTIHCRSTSGAGHFTVNTAFGTDKAMNCQYGSSRDTCPASYGCNEKTHWALCCAPLPSCGNGVVDSPQETCDDGNDDETDACLNNCSLRVPGNGAGLGC